jgi:predicted TIM-barrel fold metal-dependent hydrolase
MAPQTPVEMEDSTLTDYQKVQVAMGTPRAVIVASGAHRFDYQHLLHVLSIDPVNYRGVAILPPDITDKELAILDAAGVVGARFYPGINPPDERMLARVRDMGWSANFPLANSAQLEQWAPLIDTITGRFIIEHSGMPPVEQGLDSAHFRKILSFLDTDRCWIKVSHRFSKLHYPPFEDTLPFIHALIAKRPDRIVYGSDYPHPNYWTPMPNEADFLDLMLQWAPSVRDQERIMVRNPAEAFGFPG